MKNEGTPFNKVPDNILEVRKAIKNPRSRTDVRRKASHKAFRKGLEVSSAKKSVKMARIVGKRPLHGTKELVSMAIRRSLGESIIRHPVTPAALHPSPINMVRHCFPQVLHLSKQASRLKAILGR